MFLDLIPVNAQRENIRNLFPEYWEEIRKHAYNKLGKFGKRYTCTYCGGQGKKHPVEAHEEWAFAGGRVILVDVIPLCPSCHKIKHINFIRESRSPSATVNFDRAVSYYMRIYNQYLKPEGGIEIDLKTAYRYIYDEIDKATLQRQMEYTIDTASVESYYQRVRKEA